MIFISFWYDIRANSRVYETALWLGTEKCENTSCKNVKMSHSGHVRFGLKFSHLIMDHCMWNCYIFKYKHIWRNLGTALGSHDTSPIYIKSTPPIEHIKTVVHANANLQVSWIILTQCEDSLF